MSDPDFLASFDLTTEDGAMKLGAFIGSNMARQVVVPALRCIAPEKHGQFFAALLGAQAGSMLAAIGLEHSRQILTEVHVVLGMVDAKARHAAH